MQKKKKNPIHLSGKKTPENQRPGKAPLLKICYSALRIQQTFKRETPFMTWYLAYLYGEFECIFAHHI